MFTYLTIVIVIHERKHIALPYVILVHFKIIKIRTINRLCILIDNNRISNTCQHYKHLQFGVFYIF